MLEMPKESAVLCEVRAREKNNMENFLRGIFLTAHATFSLMGIVQGLLGFLGKKGLKGEAIAGLNERQRELLKSLFRAL